MIYRYLTIKKRFRLNRKVRKCVNKGKFLIIFDTSTCSTINNNMKQISLNGSIFGVKTILNTVKMIRYINFKLFNKLKFDTVLVAFYYPIRNYFIRSSVKLVLMKTVNIYYASGFLQSFVFYSV